MSLTGAEKQEITEAFAAMSKWRETVQGVMDSATKQLLAQQARITGLERLLIDLMNRSPELSSATHRAILNQLLEDN